MIDFPSYYTKMKNANTSIFASPYLLILISVLLILGMQFVMAAPPPASTSTPYTMTYTAKLVNASGSPIRTSQSIRFSIWSDSDWDSSDIDVAGNIDALATGFSGWQETYTITPNSDGIFTVNLGSINTLPNFSASTHNFLEVDVKPSASPATSFEVLDPDGDTANTTDRKPLTSAPYAINADTVDNHDADNTPNNIPVLDAEGKLIFGVIPDGVNADNFTLDQDNNAPDNVITLQFGNAISQFLRWSDPSGRFELSNNLDINGDLSFTGTGNITGATIDGTLNTLLNIPASALAPHVETVRLSPAYPAAVLTPDGSDNKGTLKLLYANSGPTSRYNYYNWTTNSVTIQDFDIVVRYQLPADFISFTDSPLTLTYQTADADPTHGKLDLSMLDSLGQPANLLNAASLTSAASWSDAAITFADTPTFTAGTFVEFTIKASAIDGGMYARLGDLILNYNAR